MAKIQPHIKYDKIGSLDAKKLYRRQRNIIKKSYFLEAQKHKTQNLFFHHITYFFYYSTCDVVL